jgi:cytochrome P450
MNALFLQADVADPYALYAERLATQPVWHDEANDLWALHSYAACKAVLDSAAHIPAVASDLLSPAAAAVAARLARLSNPPLHAEYRRIALHLHDAMTPVDTGALLDGLLDAQETEEVDWVGSVCKVLPPLAVLKGLRFADADIAIVLPQVEAMTKIMHANKSAAMAGAVNETVATAHPIVARHLEQLLPAQWPGEWRDAALTNLLGLLIQSYDAGRGLLSNALLQMLAHPGLAGDAQAMGQLVIETLRFDPPIHNTRRVLAEEMVLEGCRLEKGSTVLLVLAAANRDPARFSHPAEFDPARPGNDEHLSFGSGMHGCVAKHFSVRLAIDALCALRQRYAHIELRQAQLDYEPLVNARLAKEIRIGVS